MKVRTMIVTIIANEAMANYVVSVYSPEANYANTQIVNSDPAAARFVEDCTEAVLKTNVPEGVSPTL